jgi:hypothetical protein
MWQKSQGINLIAYRREKMFQIMKIGIRLGVGLCMIALNMTVPFAFAVEEEVEATPYRPTISNPAVLSAPGWLELEMGGQGIKGGSDMHRDSLPVLAKLAFSQDWGILLGGELGVRRTDTDNISYQGGGDTSLFVKHRIPTATEGTAWGFEAGYKFPTAKDTIGSGKADAILNGIYSTNFSGNHLDLNLGVTRVGAINTDESNSLFNWASALSRNLDEKWGIFGELSGVNQQGMPALSQFMAGATYNFSKRIVLDAGASTGLTPASLNSTVFAGVTVLLGRLW